MLREIKKISQMSDEPRRRWFSDEYFDLIAWYSPDDEIIGFQLCYDKDNNERTLNWMNPSTWTHYRVDDGERLTGFIYSKLINFS